MQDMLGNSLEEGDLVVCASKCRYEDTVPLMLLGKIHSLFDWDLTTKYEKELKGLEAELIKLSKQEEESWRKHRQNQKVSPGNLSGIFGGLCKVYPDPNYIPTTEEEHNLLTQINRLKDQLDNKPVQQYADVVFYSPYDLDTPEPKMRPFNPVGSKGLKVPVDGFENKYETRGGYTTPTRKLVKLSDEQQMFLKMTMV